MSAKKSRIGIVGLWHLGCTLSACWAGLGHEVVGFDADPARSDVPSLAALIDRLEAPRALWLMLPSGEPTEHALVEALASLSTGDVLVEGANSNFHDSVRRAQLCAERGVEFVDAGVSGGIWGLEVGFCLMVGGNPHAVSRVEPLFTALAPEGGYAHVGAAGAGHYTKMVHNGIEYAMLQAAAANGWIDRQRCITESLTSIARAGWIPSPSQSSAVEA